MQSELTFAEYCAIYRKAYSNTNYKNADDCFHKMIADAVARRRKKISMGRKRRVPKPNPDGVIVPGMTAY